MRTINHIIIHCTDTPEGREVSAEEVDRWHKQRGFTMIGYHYLIHRDGSIEHGRPLFMQGAHCKVRNKDSIGICYVGGRNYKGDFCDTRTPEQRKALLDLLHQLKKQFPHAQISGHRDWDRGKECPCFEAKGLNNMIL